MMTLAPLRRVTLQYIDLLRKLRYTDDYFKKGYSSLAKASADGQSRPSGNDGKDLLEITNIEQASKTRTRKEWTLVPEIRDEILEKKNFTKQKIPALPNHLQTSMDKIKEQYTKGQHKDLQEKARHFANRIVSRKRAVEEDEIAEYGSMLQNFLLEKAQAKQEKKGLPLLTDDEVTALAERNRAKVVRTMRKHVYHHSPIKYDSYEALMYMEAFMAMNFQHLYCIFKELSKQLPEYKPHTLLDFGSGVGSAMWAANSVWPSQIYEHMNVDSSPDMNTLAQLILQGGKEEGEPYFKDVYFRQFLPASTERDYNLVVCDLTLLELPTMRDRLDVLYQLWRKTQDFLVITQHGTEAGFQTILEARQFLLDVYKSKGIKQSERPNLVGHVFAPCPHDNVCPRMKKSVCKFVLSRGTARLSYVVLRKGPRPQGDKCHPRIVQGPHLSQKTFSGELCCPSGQLEHFAVSKKSPDRSLHKVMKHYKHGDLLPVEAFTEL